MNEVHNMGEIGRRKIKEKGKRIIKIKRYAVMYCTV
jgi:hypothetical protein